ncbi:MAG: DUF4468 domain-containing protein [Bacteroidota bacterium]
MKKQISSNVIFLIAALLLLSLNVLAQQKGETKKGMTVKDRMEENRIGFPVYAEKRRGIVEYPNRKPIEGQSQEQLFENGINWYLSTFKQYARGELLLEDKEAGILFGRGHSTESDPQVGQLWNIWFDVKLEIEEGAYRSTIGNFKIQLIDPKDFMNYYPLGELSRNTPIPNKKVKDQTVRRFFDHVKYIRETIDKALNQKK